MQPVAFIDFQGTLGGGGTDDIRSLALYPFSAQAVALLNRHGVLAIGATNQSHISKGELTMEEYGRELRRIKASLSLEGARFDAVYCCPHRKSDNCACKKPLTGLVDAAMGEWPMDPDKMYAVGDMGKTDMLLAKNIGAKGVLVLTGVGRGSLGEYRHTWEDAQAAHVAETLLDAARWILYDLHISFS